MNKKVFITGATGFIGAHIASCFSKRNYTIIAAKREQSDISRCSQISNISWINIDDRNWKDWVVSERPDYIIHSAWEGVDASSRSNWKKQVKNLELLMDVLSIASEANCKRFIGIGSQAEYGQISERVDEEHEASPHTAYGLAKLLSLHATKHYCYLNSIRWYWVRIFSAFGEMDNNHSLVPWLIQQLLKQETIDLTAGEQKYDYIYVQDLAKMIADLAASNAGSGVYNVSSDKSVSLKDLILQIRNITGSTSFLNFGAVPYRTGQSMLMEGSCKKYFGAVGDFTYTALSQGLQNTIEFYQTTLIKKTNESL